MTQLNKIIAAIFALALVAMPVAASAQYYGGSITANCYAVPSYAHVGDTVSWRVSVGGNNAGPYQYNWSGSDGLYGNGWSINKVYSTPGSKTASVSVYANGQTFTAQCTPNATITGNATYPQYPQYSHPPQYPQYPQYQQPQPPVFYPAPVIYHQPTPVTYGTVYNAPHTAPPVIPTEPVQYAPAPRPAAPASVAVVKTNDEDIALASAPQPNYNNVQTASTLFSLGDVPWGLIMVFVFLLIFGAIIYMLSTKQK